AFLSGGKDSYYAIYRSGIQVDIGLVLVYDFPRPSPHLVNLGKTVETILLMGIPVAVVKLGKGREFVETVGFLRSLGVDTLIAGDVYIEDHLRYMENIAKEVGAALVEPLWGMDPEDLLYKEIEDGLKPMVIGCVNGLGKWLGVVLDRDNVYAFAENAKSIGVDPLGEKGEYHTIVLSGPLHKASLSYKIVDVENYDGYKILRLI
ncbi:MAG: ATPase, partial [Ignisphaera sp.]